MNANAGADCDVLIVGAGPVGASLAAALAHAPLRVTLADARPAGDPGPPRTIALTLGSLRILEGLGVDAPGAPILRVHVSDHGHFGRVVLDAATVRVPRLGAVMAEGPLRRALLDRGRAEPLMPARLVALRQDAGGVTATLATPDGAAHTRRARLLIAADGTDSTACALAGLALRERPTGIGALVGTLRTSLPHAGTAFERFTDAGPVALLPGEQPRQRHFVWTLPSERAQRLALVGTHLLTLFGQRFGSRAGRFEALENHAHFALREAHREVLRGRVLAIGNAAHTLHPVAAQGFNLGLRDVAVLADLLADAGRGGADPGDAALLARYVASRRADWRLARTFTRLLPALFEDRGPLFTCARGAGMTALQLAPPAGRAFARAAMGLWRPRSALERALPP